MGTNPSQTGVYQILNTVNNKRYIGSAARSFRERWGKHKSDLRRGVHCNKHLQSAWNKYGESAFEFSVLHITAPEHVVAKEQSEIDYHRAANPEHGYNILPNAGSARGRKMSAESRRKISVAKKGKKMPRSHCEAMARHAKARSQDPETAAAYKQRMRRYWATPGTREAMSAQMIVEMNRPERLVKTSKVFKAYFAVSENRERHREKTAARMQKPESRQRSSEVARRYFEDPAARQAQAERARKQSSSPEIRAWRGRILAAGRLKAKLTRASNMLTIVGQTHD